MFKFLVRVLILCPLLHSAYSAETCSRIATINYQEVLVDVSSYNRGEGLRYYLGKDKVATELLNEYQKNNKPSWKQAVLSSLGSGLLVAGIVRTGGEGQALTSRNALLFSGAALILANYLISKTRQYNNETLLLKSVEEYNKRNTPRIYFSPVDANDGLGLGLGMGVSREF